MRRLMLMAVVVGALTLLIAPVGSAKSPWAGCPVGPVNAGGSTIGEWELWDQDTFEAALEAAGVDPELAEGVFEKDDKNRDGLLCVMVQVLPNDASGNTTWFVSHDNNAKEK